MRALVYTGPRTMEMREVADATAAEGEALLRVEAVGICGSDMHGWAGHDERRPAPLILGHEAAGVVLADGRRVTVNPLVTCMECVDCMRGDTNLCSQRQIISMPPREGAFAPLLAMPERNLVDIPDHISFEQASLAEPIACGTHAVRLGSKSLRAPLAEAQIGVLGGGMIGLGSALVLQAWGCSNITIYETNPTRHDILRRATRANVCSPGDGPEANSFDMVIDAYGGEITRRTACELIRPGGVIVHIGLGDANDGLDIRRMTLQEITFIGTYTYTMDDFRDTVEMISDQRLGPLDWYETRALGEGAVAFDALAAGQIAAPKIVLIPEH